MKIWATKAGASNRAALEPATPGYPHCYPQQQWITGRQAVAARYLWGRAPWARGHNRAALRSHDPFSEDDLLSIIQAAGWPIWPLILCSVAALTIIIERLISLRASQIAPASLLDEVLSVTRSSLPGTDVVNKLAENSLLGGVFATGLRSVIAEPRITEQAVRQSFESAGRIALHRLERYLNTLGTIAAAAPLLGLFGTVIGMIEIFGSQTPTAGGGTNPQQLAHGISVALYNTAFGLMIAIPALMFYRYFRGRVDEYLLTMELATERLVPHLMRFAVRSPPQPTVEPTA